MGKEVEFGRQILRRGCFAIYYVRKLSIKDMDSPIYSFFTQLR